MQCIETYSVFTVRQWVRKSVKLCRRVIGQICRQKVMHIMKSVQNVTKKEVKYGFKVREAPVK